MPSPQRPPKGSPPRRAALHERSDSQINERSLRMVGEPQAPFYGSPYPTKPSQIFPPKEYGVQGSPVGSGLGVSDGPNPSRETKQPVEASPSLSTSQVKERNAVGKQAEHASSRRLSSTVASLDISQTAKPGLDTDPHYLAMDAPAEDDGRMSDDIVQLPSVPSRLEPWLSPVSDQNDFFKRQPVQTKDSESSLSSANSTGTVIVTKHQDGKKRASYSAFPNIAYSGSSKSNSHSPTLHNSTSQELSESSSQGYPNPPSPPVPSSLATPEEHRAPSTLMYANPSAASQSSVDLQYPVIRSPAVSASWVEPVASVTRTSERNLERWNPHLSTVQSEGTASQSEGRSNRSTWLLNSSRASKSSSMALKGRVSSDIPPGENADQSFPQDPPRVLHRNSTGSTIRVVTEQEDSPQKMEPIPGSRGSDFLGAHSSTENKRNSVITRPGSKASFFRDSIPAWARAYYARPQSSSSIPKSGYNIHPSTSTDNVSLNMFRPRTRHNREPYPPPQRSSLAIEPIQPRDFEFAEVKGAPRRKTSSNWSPHLWHDKTSLGRKRTIFQAPSIDEMAEGKAPSKRNAQIALFVIGFIFPPAWFIACFVPLPAKPEMPCVRSQNDLRRTQLVEDLEKQLNPIDEARYENARWWRNMNRIMSLAGIIIVVAVITIAAVTAK